jgi:hypothetical protein
MERTMGIEPKRTMLPGLKNKRFGVIATQRANLRGM